MPIISMRGVIPAIFARSPRGWADDLAPQRLQHGQAAWRHAPLAPSIIDAPNEKGPEPKSRPPTSSASRLAAGLRARDFRDVHLDAAAHRRRDGDLADILALRARRLGLDQSVDPRVEVRAQVFRRERRLADARVDDAG